MHSFSAILVPVFLGVSDLQGVEISVFPLTLLSSLQQCCHYHAVCDQRVKTEHYTLYLRIPYTAHVTNPNVLLRAGSPPQLLPLIQTRWLRFFGHVARMSDSQDTFRALHSTYVDSRAAQGLETPPRTSTSHLASDPKCRPPSAQPRTQLR